MSWKCEDCKWENADKWDKCANCGKPSGLPPKIETKEDKIFRYVVVSLLAIFFLIVLLLIPVLDEFINLQSNSPVSNMETSAYKICINFIGAELLVPSTAKYQSQNKSEINQIDKYQYEVILYVDSQNFFDEYENHQYICRVTYQPNKDRWLLDGVINIDELRQ